MTTPSKLWSAARTSHAHTGSKSFSILGRTFPIQGLAPGCGADASTGDVLICSQAIRLKSGGTFIAYTIINKDEDREEVGAARIGHK